MRPSPSRSFSFTWTVVAAFSTYFCMYGFRKPFTAGSYDDGEFGGLGFKETLVIAQVLGYMLSKFIGIKVIAEMPAGRRISSIVLLIGLAELALLGFALTPRPWNALFLFLNGLPLGMVFGLVLGFLEGRRLTEALAAGLCTSFILADGVTKTIGAWLLDLGVSEAWMPAAAGAIFVPPLLVSVALLSRTPPPSEADEVIRAPRQPIDRGQRRRLFQSYAGGLMLLIGTYLVVTVLRSLRADFAPQIWQGLAGDVPPGIYTQSELWVALGVLVANGLAVLVVDNRKAFFVSLLTCLSGFVLMGLALIGWRAGAMEVFPFMVLIGLGLYLPYVAMHTTVFERLLAMTRGRGNLGFLMYLADSFGYLGYVGVMLGRNLLAPGEQVATFFITACWAAVVTCGLGLLAASWYFAVRCPAEATEPVVTLQPEAAS